MECECSFFSSHRVRQQVTGGGQCGITPCFFNHHFYRAHMPNTYRGISRNIVPFYIITATLQLNPYKVLPSATFWSSCGPRCLTFFPPVHAFIFYRAWGQTFPSFQLVLLSSLFTKEKVPTRTTMHSLKLEPNPRPWRFVGARFTRYSIRDAD